MAVHKRKRGPESRQVTDERLRLAIAAGGIGTWEYDPAADFTLVSPELRAMFGFERNRPVTPEVIFSALSEDGRRQAKEAFQKALDPRGDGHYHAVYCIRRASDGEERWIKSIGRAFFCDGQAVRVIGTSRDVTDEVKMERLLSEKTQLAEQLATMAACVAAVPGVVGTLHRSRDGKECFPYMSAKFRNVYGLDPEIARTDLTPVAARRHPDDAQEYRAAIMESARTGAELHHQFRWLHPQKGIIWLEVQATPVAQPDGGCLWHGYVQDITARKNAEEKLRASEARFRAIFDSNLIGVFFGNASTGAVTDANDKFLEMIGYSREELAAGEINWKTATSPPSRGVAEAAAAEIIRTGKTSGPFESEAHKKDGSLMPALITAALLDKSSCEAIAFVLDISERKLNEERERKLHTEQIETMKSLAAGIAHEINQPLAALGAYLKVMSRLLKMPPEQRPRSIAETLDNAFEQTVRAGEIVSRLRSFIAHGEPDQFLLSAHELIHEALNTTAPALEHAGVKLSLRLQAAQDDVLADRTQIVLVLVNLFNNAIEAMESTPRRELVVSTTSTDKDIRIDVIDTGVGLSEKMKSNLFEPFATTKPSGMGVGLSISRAIVEAHHGRMWAESAPEGGAIFSFSMPLASNDGENTAMITGQQ